MRRTQVYLDEELWKALHAHARKEGTSISEFLRQAVRDRYMPHRRQRDAALVGIVGLWKDRTDLPDTETYVRSLRKDTRRQRMGWNERPPRYGRAALWTRNRKHYPMPQLTFY
jgi:metal-responsive CopG/Arc/MetJ family transcriptional regulator